MFEERKDYGYFIFLVLNWIFGLLFLWAGFFDAKTGGLIIILVSLLLLPPVRNFVFSFTHKKIPLWARSLSITSLLMVFLVVNNQKPQALHLAAQSTVPANTETISNTISKMKETLPKKVAELQSLKTQQSLQSDSESTESTKNIKVAHESTKIFTNKSIDIEATSITKINVPEKVAQIEPTNTKQISQIKNNKEDSETKTKEILAKLKNIPVSQYELNRNLYQQLVNFNPNKDKYKKKLGFYSKKIEQRSRNTAQKELKLTCENISKNNTFNDSPNWLSANGHCLSKDQKKKMELALFKRVRKISSKNIIKNWEGYKSLSILNPNKKYYLNKMKQYQNKLKLRTAKV